MPKKYRPKIKGYVLPYIYVDNRLLLLVTMEKLKEPGEYYSTLLGGTSKNLREVKESTVRELCEETRGYIQVDKSNLIEYMTINDRDRCTIYLLPLSNGYELIHEINAFKNGVLMPPECAESSFIIALGVDELLSWTHNTGPSSEPYYYFRKPFVNRYPLTSYKKFMEYFDGYGDQGPAPYYKNRRDRLIKEEEMREESDSSKSSGSSKGSDNDDDLEKIDFEEPEREYLGRQQSLPRPIPSHRSYQRDWVLNPSREKLDKPMNEIETLETHKSLSPVVIDPRMPQIWIGERLARVLHGLDELFLAEEFSKQAINYKYADLRICDCNTKGSTRMLVKVPSGPSGSSKTQRPRMPKMHSI